MTKKRKEAAFSVKEAKKLAPNCITCSGGHLAEIPLPIIRFFDDKRRKREVKVLISIFPLGSHYYVDITEEDDAVLDRSNDSYKNRPVWRECWDDKKGQGMRFSERFNSKSDAAHYIKKVWKKEFSSKTHKLQLRSREFIRRLKKLGVKATYVYI